jgi:pimeloyl-ACP methyl ester carboxylesterase
MRETKTAPFAAATASEARPSSVPFMVGVTRSRYHARERALPFLALGSAPMSTFVLVHGAWHGGWCWERVAPLLRRMGHSVVAPDLPGHGADTSPWWRATLGSYAGRVCDAARASGGHAIAVGHSMGGVVISEASAREPALFAGLAYVCAFAPAPGVGVRRPAGQDRDAVIRKAMQRGLTRTTIDPMRAAEVFYNTCSVGDASAATARLVAEPMLPLLQRASHPRGEQPARGYVECTEDRAIGVAHQRFMRERAGIAHVATLATDHSPFYSAPGELASALGDLATKLGA